MLAMRLPRRGEGLVPSARRAVTPSSDVATIGLPLRMSEHGRHGEMIRVREQMASTRAMVIDGGQSSHAAAGDNGAQRHAEGDAMVTLALAGDVMLGRGLDQIPAHPGDPALRERYVLSARDYLALAERASGPIPRGVSPAYVWGDALPALAGAERRIVNLETSITTSPYFAPKGINYRMHPANTGVLHAAHIDCCTLANNHVMDFGGQGLLETLETLAAHGIAVAGAGRDLAQATAPAILPLMRSGRIVVVAFGMPSSGIPRAWAATPNRPGVHLVETPDEASLQRLAALLRQVRRPGDIAVASMHWGPNWGYEVSPDMRAFAQGLIARAGFQLVHGHSTHHPTVLELHGEGAILYGAGDFLNDYEGIGGYESVRPQLTALYLTEFEPETGRLARLRLVPFRIERFRLVSATPEEGAWLYARISRESARYGTDVVDCARGMLEARRMSALDGDGRPQPRLGR
jgi:poly-gamma-glutamate synthesis protein (capsule biosynthesis protein)